MNIRLVILQIFLILQGFQDNILSTLQKTFYIVLFTLIQEKLTQGK